MLFRPWENNSPQNVSNLATPRAFKCQGGKLAVVSCKGEGVKESSSEFWTQKPLTFKGSLGGDKDERTVLSRSRQSLKQDMSYTKKKKRTTSSKAESSLPRLGRKGIFTVESNPNLNLLGSARLPQLGGSNGLFDATCLVYDLSYTRTHITPRFDLGEAPS